MIITDDKYNKYQERRLEMKRIKITGKRLIPAIFAPVILCCLISNTTYGGSKEMKPLYELRGASTITPQVYKIDRENEMTPFIQSTGISIYPVPLNNAVATNQLADAVTVISFAEGKIRYDRFFNRTLISRHADNCFLPNNIPDTMGLIEAPWLLMYNLKTKALKKIKVLPDNDSIRRRFVANAGKKQIIFHQEEEALDSGSQKSKSAYSLVLMETNGSTLKLIKKRELGERMMFATAHDKIFFWRNRENELQVLDMKLEPSKHPLSDIIKRNKINISEIHFHPTLPFAILSNHEGAISVSWGEQRDNSPSLLIKRVMDFQFSSDGKWVTFTYGWFMDQVRKTYLMPVSEKYPCFLGRPILLLDDDFVPGKSAWTQNPVSFVGSQSGRMHRWELTNAHHPESDKPTYHDFVVDKDIENPPVKIEVLSYKSKRSEKFIVRLDPFSPIRESSFRVSPDCRRVAYVSEGIDRVAAVIDGKVGNQYDNISDLIFSPDGRRVAYLARVNNQSLAVVDTEEENQEYDNMAALAFSPDGKRVAYGAAQNKKWFFVMDGKRGKQHYEGVAAITFSPDSKRVAFAAFQDNQWFVVVDGKAGKRYDAVGALVFSPDGRRIAYVAKAEGKTFVVVDEKDGTKCDAVGAALVFSPDSKRFAYAAVVDHQWSVIVDEKASKPYDVAGGWVFSPDSRRMAYVAQSKGKWFAVLDGEEERQYDQINMSGIVFSPDSKRLAYGALLNHQWFAVIDGEEQNRRYDNIGTILFSPDSRRVVYPAQTNHKAVAVIDGKEGYPYEAIWSIVFSPDSQRLAYAAKEDRKVFVVSSGKEGKKYDDILTQAGGRVMFDAPDILRYIAINDREIDPGDEDEDYDTALVIGDRLYLVEEKIIDNE